MAVKKSSANKQQEKKRWLDGYKFWRGQYTVRNNEFTAMEKVREELKNEFINKSRATLDKDVADYLGIGDNPKPPIINDKYIQTVSALPTDIYNVMAQISCLDNYIAKFFPNHFTPKRIDSKSIIFSLLDLSFETYIDLERLKKESLIYKGVSYFDVSRNVILVSSETAENKFVTLEIDSSADIGHILKSVCCLIEAHKVKIGEEFCSCKEFVDIDLEIFLTKKRPGVAYNVGTRSDNSRAIGLWVHDYMEQNGCIQAAAIEAFVRLPYLKDLGGTDSGSYRDALKRIHRRTKKCIERAEVLKIQ